MTKKECGTCSMCCKLLEITSLRKPANTWCGYCTPGKGCTNYRLRPKLCREFQCLWLQEDWLADEWKPSVSKFVMMWEYDQQCLTVVTDPKLPNAWKAEPYYTALKLLSKKHLDENRLVMVVIGASRYVILPDRDVLVGGVNEEFGWKIKPIRDGSDQHYDLEFERLAKKTALDRGQISTY